MVFFYVKGWGFGALVNQTVNMLEVVGPLVKHTVKMLAFLLGSTQSKSWISVTMQQP